MKFKTVIASYRGIRRLPPNRIEPYRSSLRIINKSSLSKMKLCTRNSQKATPNCNYLRRYVVYSVVRFAGTVMSQV